MAKTSGRSVNDGPTVPSQFGAPNPDNRTGLGFATKSGKIVPASRAEKARKALLTAISVRQWKTEPTALLVLQARLATVALADEPGADVSR